MVVPLQVRAMEDPKETLKEELSTLFSDEQNVHNNPNAVVVGLEDERSVTESENRKKQEQQSIKELLAANKMLKKENERLHKQLHKTQEERDNAIKDELIRYSRECKKNRHAREQKEVLEVQQQEKEACCGLWNMLNSLFHKKRHCDTYTKHIVV